MWVWGQLDIYTCVNQLITENSKLHTWGGCLVEFLVCDSGFRKHKPWLTYHTYSTSSLCNAPSWTISMESVATSTPWMFNYFPVVRKMTNDMKIKMNQGDITDHPCCVTIYVDGPGWCSMLDDTENIQELKRHLCSN